MGIGERITGEIKSPLHIARCFGELVLLSLVEHMREVDDSLDVDFGTVD